MLPGRYREFMVEKRELLVTLVQLKLDRAREDSKRMSPAHLEEIRNKIRDEFRVLLSELDVMERDVLQAVAEGKK